MVETSSLRHFKASNLVYLRGGEFILPYGLEALIESRLWQLPILSKT